MVDERIKKTINEYLTEVKNLGIEIKKVFLYGSYAYGKPTSSSDIDLLLVCVEDIYSNEEITSKLWLATESVNHKIEPTYISETDFVANKFSPLLDLVKAKGLEIAA